MKNTIAALVLCSAIVQGQFSITINNTGGAQRAAENNLFHADIKNAQGRIVYSLERTIPFDVPFPSVHFSESSAMTLLSYTFDGFVEVYNERGIKIWGQNFFKEMGPEYERTITAAIGTSSILFLTSDVTLPNAYVHKFSFDGAKLWERSLPFSTGGEIVVSPDEKTIAAASYQTTDNDIRRATVLFDHNGVQKGIIEILFQKGSFSNDGTMLALISRDEAVIASTQTGTAIERVKKENPGTIFTDLCWDNNNIVIQEASVITSPIERFQYSNPVFTWYTPEMKILKVEKMFGTTYRNSSMKSVRQGIRFTFDANEKMLVR